MYRSEILCKIHLAMFYRITNLKRSRLLKEFISNIYSFIHNIIVKNNISVVYIIDMFLSSTSSDPLRDLIVKYVQKN